MLRVAAERARLAQSFSRFARAAWCVLRGGDDLVWSWHMEELCDHLQAVSERRIKRLVVALPPGLSKSTLTCVLWPAWHWIGDPAHRWMFVSVDPALVRRDALESRALIESDWYQRRWGDKVQIVSGKEKADGSLEYYTTAGGLRFGTSLKAKGVGWHVHTQVGDDLIKPTEAGPAPCALAHNAWQKTFASRRATPRGKFARVLLQQRLSQFDMIALGIEQGYEQLILPMRHDPERYDLPDEDPRALRRSSLWNGKTGGDRRTVPGELLCPALVGEDDIPDLERETDYRVQQEQDPTASSERVWDRAKLSGQRYSALPRGGRYTWDWDLASKGQDQRKSKRGSHTVGWCWYETEHASYLVEEVRNEEGRDAGDYPWQREAVRRAYRRRRGTVYVEDKANGPAVQADLRAEVRGDMVMVPACKSKLERATAVTGYQDRVYLPRAPWVDDVLAELDRFPGKPDDRGDVLSQHLSRRWLEDQGGEDEAAREYARRMQSRR